jgi:hypothetical protein
MGIQGMLLQGAEPDSSFLKLSDAESRVAEWVPITLDVGTFVSLGTLGWRDRTVISGRRLKDSGACEKRSRLI